MSAPGTRRVNLLLVAILLSISILLEQYWIARFFPWIGGLGGFRPMVVFLDIPLALPQIDWIPVSILFVIFYSIVISPELSRGNTGNRRLVRKKIWSALTGWWLLLGCILAGGGIYYLAQDWLPQQVRNGIDSFGLRADITLPWPSGDLIHLHGSMLLLLFFGIGLYFLSKRTTILTPAEVQAITEAPAPVKAPAIAQAPATIAQGPPVIAQTPKPPPAKSLVYVQEPAGQPTCRLTIPPPIAVVVPRAAPGIGKMHPCVFTGVHSYTADTACMV